MNNGNNVQVAPIPMQVPAPRPLPMEVYAAPPDLIVPFNVQKEIHTLQKTQAKLDQSIKYFALLAFLGFCALQFFVVVFFTLGFGSLGIALYYKM
jgi:hypothetical protein